MKNSFAIFLMVFVVVAVFSSCSNDDDAANNPYAYIKSFGVGDIKSEYPVGEDSVVVKTIGMEGYPFTINQVTGEIYNGDSLPYKTNLTKIVVNMSVEGVAQIFDENSGAYEYFSSSDSIDFTSPRKFKILSLDGNYSKDYTVSINAHKVEPNMMEWNRVARLENVLPLKALEFKGNMFVFGVSEGKPVVAISPIEGDVAWEKFDLGGLSLAADFSAIQQFNGELYAVADGALYKSADAVSWNIVPQSNYLVAVVEASDAEGRMWLAGRDALYTTADGVSFEMSGTLPGDFPLYGISSTSYTLKHHSGIVRYMLVGYAAPEMDGKPQVFSKLSTESSWSKYDNVGNPYPCPSLKGLTVMRYDDALYAVGGHGVVNETEVDAFDSFFVSKDNGIVWKASEDPYQSLPETLKGNDTQFAAVVDSRNYMWIITSGDNAVAWKGIINRLGFSK